MKIIPAIDLKENRCVRLYQGDMTQETVYSDDPAAMANRWAALGAERLHLVDLNGAFAGELVNGESIRAVLDAVKIPVQLGGGIRAIETIERLLTWGVHTVILGTVACRNPDFVQKACRLFPGSISVGIDARDGYVAVQGWAETTDINALELAKRFEDVGVTEIIYTDITRDGALTGPNIETTRRLAASITTPVIVSGGVSSLSDIQDVLNQSGPFESGGRISGVITGKALYDGRLDFTEALALCRALCRVDCA